MSLPDHMLLPALESVSELPFTWNGGGDASTTYKTIRDERDGRVHAVHPHEVAAMAIERIEALEALLGATMGNAPLHVVRRHVAEFRARVRHKHERAAESRTTPPREPTGREQMLARHVAAMNNPDLMTELINDANRRIQLAIGLPGATRPAPPPPPPAIPKITLNVPFVDADAPLSLPPKGTP